MIKRKATLLPKNFVPGNYEDKYNTKNPISLFLVRNFIKKYKEGLLYIKSKKSVNRWADLGCGEGYLLKEGINTLGKNLQIHACDLSPEEIEKAKKNLKGNKIKFSIQNVENLSKYKSSYFDLVTCCEVLEHVKYPSKALKEIRRILKNDAYALISVPKEPIWRILNILRGKYLNRLGNTPGHLNHWSTKRFKAFIENHGFKIILNLSPFPWTMFVIKKS